MSLIFHAISEHIFQYISLINTLHFNLPLYYLTMIKKFIMIMQKVVDVAMCSNSIRLVVMTVLTAQMLIFIW